MTTELIKTARQALVSLSDAVQFTNGLPGSNAGLWQTAALELTYALGYTPCSPDPVPIDMPLDIAALHAARRTFEIHFKKEIQEKGTPLRDLITVSELLEHWQQLRELPGSTQVHFGGIDGISIRYESGGVAIDEYGYRTPNEEYLDEATG